MDNVICWFEIYVNDIDRAKKFYSTVLGTQFYDMEAPGDTEPVRMSCFSAPDGESMAVSGALIESKEDTSPSLSTIVYFPCMDCAVEEARVEAAGGKVCQPKMNLGAHGFCAICMDTEGNSFGLYSMQ